MLWKECGEKMLGSCPYIGFNCVKNLLEILSTKHIGSLRGVYKIVCEYDILVMFVLVMLILFLMQCLFWYIKKREVLKHPRTWRGLLVSSLNY